MLWLRAWLGHTSGTGVNNYGTLQAGASKARVYDIGAAAAEMAHSRSRCHSAQCTIWVAPHAKASATWQIPWHDDEPCTALRVQSGKAWYEANMDVLLEENESLCEFVRNACEAEAVKAEEGAEKADGIAGAQLLEHASDTIAQLRLMGLRDPGRAVHSYTDIIRFRGMAGASCASHVHHWPRPCAPRR